MKFSIRDLFLVTVIVAVCTAWWLDHRRQAIRADALIEKANESSGGLVMLQGIVENYGYKVRWEMKTGQMRVEPELPFFQAPAPNPPKNQSGPDVDP